MEHPEPRRVLLPPLPRHPAVLKSLEELFKQSRGEGNPLLFDLQVFLRSIKVFSSLTHKQAFVLPTFIPSAFLLPLGLEHQEVSVFLFTMEKDILPLSSVSVVWIRSKFYHLWSFPFLNAKVLSCKKDARAVAVFMNEHKVT